MTLDEAISAADLPGLVARFFPDSGARPGQAGTYKAVWRGETHPSFSVFKGAKGRWLWRDHATGESGNAWHFLRHIVGLSESDTLRELGVGEKERLTWREMLAEAQRRLKSLGRLPKEMEGRGFTHEDLVRLGFGVDKEGTYIPIYGPTGQVETVKIRRTSPPPKYRYLEPGLGARPWYSPGFGNAPRPVLVVEGELNAIVAHLAYPHLDYIGLPGAETSPDWGLLVGRKVFLAADGDEAGKRALERLKGEAASRGILPLVLPPLERDFCEIAGVEGKSSLVAYLQSATRYLYTELVGTEAMLAGIKELLGNVLVEAKTPLGITPQGLVVYRYQAWLSGQAPVLIW